MTLYTANKLLIKISKILSDEKIAGLINSLVRVRSVGYFSYIERELGLKPYRLSSIVNKLKEQGIGFTAEIDYGKIGLDIMALHLNDKIVRFNDLPHIDWVKSYGLTIHSLGTYIQYYIPRSYRRILIGRIKDIIRRKTRTENIELYYFTHNIRKQPTLTSNFLEEHLLKGYTLGELEEIFTQSDELRKALYFPEYGESSSNKPNDIVDLILVKEFEKDAFTNLYDISRKLSLPLSLLNKHLTNHVIGNSMIKGIFLQSNIYVMFLGDPQVILIKTNKLRHLEKLVNLFYMLENIIGISYSKTKDFTGYYPLQVVLFRTKQNMNNIYLFLAQLRDAEYIDRLRITEFIRKHFRKFTIPYKNYYQEKRDWDLDTEKTHELFSRRFKSG